jgi:hypothetical protein
MKESTHRYVAADGFLLLLIAIVAITQWSVLAGRETYCFRDFGTTHRPAFALAAQGKAEQWNDHASFGQPMRDNPNLLLRYPTVHAPRATGIHLFLHFVIGLIGMRFFLRSMGCSAEGAVFGAIAFALSGYVVSSVSFLNASTTIAWMPWLLHAAIRLREDLKPWIGAAIAVTATTLLILGGEPVVAAMAMVVALLLVLRRPFRAVALAGAIVAALALTSPVWWDVITMAGQSRRVVTGYDFDEAVSASLHPARLLETFVPFLFGRPDRIVAGAWWGFRVSRGEFPYLYSLALGVVPLAIVAAGRRRAFWLALAAVSLLIAFGGYLPGARALYELLPLGAIRYPIKAFLLTTLAVAVLAAFAFDDLREGRCSMRARKVFVGAALVTLALAVVVAVGPGRIVAMFQARWWDPAWRTSSAEVIGPVVAAMPMRLLFVAAAFAAIAYAITGQRGTLLIVITTLDLVMAARPLLPTVPAGTYEVPSSFVKTAASLGGRLFERAGKDIDAVRRGRYGVYAADDVRGLIAAQTRQGWALAGAPHGVRYAYDRDPDGSYTWRNDIVSLSFDRKPWDVRLRWLRAAGVKGVIAYRLPSIEGLTPIATSEGEGVPNELYRIEGTLPEVRRVSIGVRAESVQKAMDLFEASAFDWRTTIVVERGDPLNGIDPDARVMNVQLLSDFMECDTSGGRPGYVFVARSFSPRATASIDGRKAQVFPANAHLIAVPVPPGTHHLRVVF